MLSVLPKRYAPTDKLEISQLKVIDTLVMHAVGIESNFLKIYLNKEKRCVLDTFPGKGVSLERVWKRGTLEIKK